MELEPELEDEPAVEELLRAGRSLASHPLSSRERVVELLVGGAFLAAATAMALLLEAERSLAAGPAVLLVLAFALATRVQLDVGPGYTVPTQLVFVPMLLLLPTPLVPLLVAAGWLLGKLSEVVGGGGHADRVLLFAANSWFSVGPAAVLVAAGAQTPDWGDWPWYVAAFVAQVACDVVSVELRESLGRGLPARLQLRMLGWVLLIDALISPTALLAAFAADEQPYTILLLVPIVGIFLLFGRERARRIRDALALAERSREAAGLSERLLSRERDTVRDRERLLAGASSDILTPLGRITALAYRLRASGADRASVDALLRETQQLRHVAGQFLDFSTLQAGRELDVTVRPCAIEPALHRAVHAFSDRRRLRVDIPDDLPPVLADEGRTQQIVMNLLSNALKYSPAGSPVRLAAGTADGRVQIVVEDSGPGIPERELSRVFEELRRGSTAEGTEGAGLGLFLSRILAEAQDAELTLETRPGEGCRFTLSLGAAPSR